MHVYSLEIRLLKYFTNYNMVTTTQFYTLTAKLYYSIHSYTKIHSYTNIHSYTKIHTYTNIHSYIKIHYYTKIYISILTHYSSLYTTITPTQTYSIKATKKPTYFSIYSAKLQNTREKFDKPMAMLVVRNIHNYKVR